MITIYTQFFYMLHEFFLAYGELSLGQIVDFFELILSHDVIFQFLT